MIHPGLGMRTQTAEFAKNAEDKERKEGEKSLLTKMLIDSPESI